MVVVLIKTKNKTFCEDCDHDRSYIKTQKRVLIMRTTIMVAALRNIVPTIRIFEVVREIHLEGGK